MSNQNKIINVIADTLGCEVSRIKVSHNLTEEYGADSLDFVELSDMLEREFEIELPVPFQERAQTVKDVIDLVSDQVEGKK